MSWKDIEWYNVKKGMLIRGTTYTHSQKWFKPEYAQYNCSIYGIVDSQYHQYNTDIIVQKIYVDYTIEPDIEIHSDKCCVVADVGTSGGTFIQVYIGTEEETNQIIKTLRQ